MKIDGVFSGGGVKAFAIIGALQTLESQGHSFVRVAGTSSGAIIAGFLAAGYQAKEIEGMLDEVELKRFLDETKLGKYIPFLNWVKLFFTLGLYKGDTFEQWLYHKLALKGIYTFKQIPAGHLKIIASDLTLGRMVVIPDDLQRFYGIKPEKFLISKAIRMSATLPYFFRPEKIQNNYNGKSIIVDGGFLSNFPVWIFNRDEEIPTRPLLGVRLSESIEHFPTKKIRNALDMAQALLTTTIKARDTRYINNNHISGKILTLPVDQIDSSDLSLSNEKKQQLIKLGKEKTSSFLKKWPE